MTHRKYRHSDITTKSLCYLKRKGMLGTEPSKDKLKILPKKSESGICSAKDPFFQSVLFNSVAFIVQGSA